MGHVYRDLLPREEDLACWWLAVASGLVPRLGQRSQASFDAGQHTERPWPILVFFKLSVIDLRSLINVQLRRSRSFVSSLCSLQLRELAQRYHSDS